MDHMTKIQHKLYARTTVIGKTNGRNKYQDLATRSTNSCGNTVYTNSLRKMPVTYPYGKLNFFFLF